MLLIRSTHQLFTFVRCQSTKSAAKWPSSRVRQTFVDYFTQRSPVPHTVIPSSSVVPPKDSGTYFVNSGMNQFKNIFLSQHNLPSRQCVVNYQKCIRVGGKHNDLSDVGHDTYHHTFFEMLGNWSFNNAYFKRQACQMAYELLTRVYGLDKNRLFFTYFKGETNLIEPDDETRQIWMELGVDPKRILPFGMKENFWEMGEVGPCGPCTEIHYDHTGEGDPLQVNRDNPRVVELWNLVFMQYERRQDKSLIPLPHVHVDTGMGLERLVAVLNRLESNYDTDLFTPLFDAIHSHCPTSSAVPAYCRASTSQQYAYRLLADHARMFTVAIGDGLVPEKKGIGGLMKKMIERAARIAHENLQIDEENVAVLSKLIPIATEILAPAYPDLPQKCERTTLLVRSCELNYMKKYKLAKPFLQRFMHEKLQKSGSILTGDEIHQLYSGKIEGINVPIEMIEDYARAHPALQPDWSRYEELMNEETRKSKLNSVYNKTIRDNQNISHHPTDRILELLRQSPAAKPTVDEPFKYQLDQPLPARLQWLMSDQCDVTNSVVKNGKYYLLLDRTNFYATGGGQSSDHGTIRFPDGLTFQVEYVFRLHEYVLHYGAFEQDGRVDDGNVQCDVDRKRRLNLSRNHTATHLLNKVLRDVLNDPGLIQKASLIHEDYFIFEYSSTNITATKTVFDEVEQRVNGIIRHDLPVSTSFLDYNSIRNDSSISRLSNELYPSNVRCVNIDSTYSRELCCGTHVSSTSEIEDFLVVRVDSKGQSNKRLYGLTGPFARQIRERFANDFQRRFHQLETNREQLPVDELYNECRKLRETYLDDKSLSFPFNQRSTYLERWHQLAPEKKNVRKYFANQLNGDLTRKFMRSNTDLPIYDVGYMLLRYDDDATQRADQPYVIYVNYAQAMLIVYLKRPRQRAQLIEHMANRHAMRAVTNFDGCDQATRELFTTTKKLVVFQPSGEDSFARIDFDRLCDELFAHVF